jgi:hypothetical protein
VATSTELRDWLVAAQTHELVRRTAHWMDEAVKHPDAGYRDDPGLTGDAFAWALAHSPGPFQIRGILIEADSLASV